MANLVPPWHTTISSFVVQFAPAPAFKTLSTLQALWYLAAKVGQLPVGPRPAFLADEFSGGTVVGLVEETTRRVHQSKALHDHCKTFVSPHWQYSSNLVHYGMHWRWSKDVKSWPKHVIIHVHQITRSYCYVSMFHFAWRCKVWLEKDLFYYHWCCVSRLSVYRVKH